MAILNDRLGQFHESGDRRDCRRSTRSPASWRPTSTRTAAPTWSRACANGPVLAWRNIDGANHRGRDQADLRVMADQRGQLADGAGHRPRPRRLARPAGAAGRHEQARRTPLARLGPQRRESLRGASLAARSREPRPRRDWSPSTWSATRCPISSSFAPAKRPRWRETWATASTGWHFSWAATGGSSPS